MNALNITAFYAGICTLAFCVSCVVSFVQLVHVSQMCTPTYFMITNLIYILVHLINFISWKSAKKKKNLTIILHTVITSSQIMSVYYTNINSLILLHYTLTHISIPPQQYSI